MKVETTEVRTIDLPAGPLALKEAQRNALTKITRGFNSTLSVVDGLDAGLSPEVRTDRKRTARNAYHEEHATLMEEVRKADKSAQVIEAAHLSTDAIRARAILDAPPADVAATVAIVAGTNGSDLQAVAVEAYRKSDFVTAAIVAREVGRRVGAETLDTGDASVVLELVERVPIPGPDAVALEAVQSVQIDAVDCESIYRSGSIGEPLTPVDRLSIERRKESIRNGGTETPFVIVPGDSARYEKAS